METKRTTWISKAFRVLLYIFAGIGLLFVGVYFAMQAGLLNVRGSVSQRNLYFNFTKKPVSDDSTNSLETVCRINTLGKYAPLTSINIYSTLSHGGSVVLISQMLETASKRFNNDARFVRDMSECEGSNTATFAVPMSAYNWADTDQWNLMKEVFIRDQDIINKAAKDAGVSPRIILAGVIGEQFRFFNNRREAFKTYFEPLKILASLSNTSFGIAGLKPKTVMQIEDHLADSNSPYYLGPSMEHVADHDPAVDLETDRMNRITDTKNPYYSYFYVGLFMRQIETQWKNAGYDLSNRPDILATLYNLGFYYSVPKNDPQSGGSMINVNGVDYVFGDIGYEFYYSGELSETFPVGVQ